MRAAALLGAVAILLASCGPDEAENRYRALAGQLWQCTVEKEDLRSRKDSLNEMQGACKQRLKLVEDQLNQCRIESSIGLKIIAGQ